MDAIAAGADEGPFDVGAEGLGAVFAAMVLAGGCEGGEDLAFLLVDFF